MKMIFLFSSILFLVAVNVGAAEPIGALRILSGNDWNKWDHEKKLGFIDGFMCGSDWVATNSLFPDSDFFPHDRKGDTIRQGAKAIWEQVTNEAGQSMSNQRTQIERKYTSMEVLLYSMYDSYKKNELYNKAIIKTPNTEIVSGMNQFYIDPANAKVLISNAVYLVKKKLNGAPTDDINELLPYLRGEKENRGGWGIFPVYDKNGKVVRVIEFP